LRPGRKPDPGPPGVGSRCTTHTQIPPGCTPRLQFTAGRLFGGIARSAFPRWHGASRAPSISGRATVHCTLRMQVGEHATEARWLSRPSFSVNGKGVGSGGARRLLAAPRGANPGAVASKGPVKSFCWVLASDALSGYVLRPHAVQ
jgi:hypothetical protein